MPSGPVCARSCGASFITATVSSKIDSGISTSMTCSTILSGTFVCEQPSSLVYSVSHATHHAAPFLKRFLNGKLLRPSLSNTFCFLFSVLSYAERGFLSILISLCFVVQSSCCFCGALATGTSTVSLCLLNVRSVLFEILLRCGKSLPLVERHRAIFSC